MIKKKYALNIIPNVLIMMVASKGDQQRKYYTSCWLAAGESLGE